MKVIVSTCDKYNWVLPVFFHFYKKAWPGNPNKTDVVTEKEKVDFGDSVFYTGGKSWGSGMINYLNQSKANKFMLILEDYIIESVDVKMIKVAEKLCSGDVGCVRMSNDPHKYFEKHTENSTVVNGFRQYPNDQRFNSALQIAIYQKAYLLDIFKGKENVWETERRGVDRIRKLGDKWRILWPEKNIFEYDAIGLLRKGILRPPVLSWAKSKLSKYSPEYKILQDQIEKQLGATY